MELDLLSCSELRDAQAYLASAHARQAEAARRFRCAPHGQRIDRLKALQEAVQGSLKAEIWLAQVQSRARCGA